MARRIILLGKTGNGKSSIGNTLFLKQVFETRKSPKAITVKCEMREDNLLNLQVVDSPGLFDTETKLGKRALEIQSAVKMCRNPHAFLLVFSASNRMTPEEKFTIDLMRVIFGENIFDHSIIVFTRGCELDDDKEFESFCAEFEDLSGLVKRCKNRVIRIENGNGCNSHTGRNVVSTIISEVDKLSDHGRFLYSYQYLDIHREELEKHSEEYMGFDNIYEELNALSERLSKRLDRRVWRGNLGGFAIGAAVGTGIIEFVKNNIHGWISGFTENASLENASSTEMDNIQTAVLGNLGETALKCTTEVGKEVVTKTCTEATVAELGKAVLEKNAEVGGDLIIKTVSETTLPELGKAALENATQAGEAIAKNTDIETTVAEVGKAAIGSTLKVGEAMLRATGIDTAVIELGKVALETTEKVRDEIVRTTGIDLGVTELGRATL